MFHAVSVGLVMLASLIVTFRDLAGGTGRIAPMPCSAGLRGSRVPVTIAAIVAVAVRAAAAQPAVTFNRDIAPIVFEHCAPCHRPGEIGPFSLLSYDDVRQHATQIALVTGRRGMPPWKPEPGKGEVIGNRSLTAAQIRLIHEWIASGGKEGDPADLPRVPQGTSGW